MLGYQLIPPKWHLLRIVILLTTILRQPCLFQPFRRCFALFGCQCAGSIWIFSKPKWPEGAILNWTQLDFIGLVTATVKAF